MFMNVPAESTQANTYLHTTRQKITHNKQNDRGCIVGGLSDSED